MTVILTLALVAAVFLLVGFPILSSTGEDREPAGGALAGEAAGSYAEEKERIFRSLAELEFDHQMKKLSEEDYRALSARLRRQAVALLRLEEEAQLQEAAAVPEQAREEGEQDRKDLELVWEEELERAVEEEIAQELARLREGRPKAGEGR